MGPSQGVPALRPLSPVVCLLSLASLMSLARVAVAGEFDAGNPMFGSHYGYLQDVREERNRRDIEMVMLERPREPEKPLSEVIFNEKLSKEFQQQYQYKFGATQAEQVLNTPSRSEDYTFYSGESVTVEEYQHEQRRFGEYMSRRLMEYHVDNWAKNDPDFKAVYQAKERFSNLNMQVKKGYKIKWKYNLSGPNMEVTVDNPYEVECKVRVEMSGVISSPNETIYTLGYPLTDRIRVQARVKEQDGIYQLVGTRRVNSHVSTSITASTDRRREGAAVQQDLVLLGFTWNE